MAKNSIRDYDNTSGNNTDIQSVDISEGCSPAGINNAIREVMADLADVNDGTVALTSPSFDAATITGDLTVDTNTLHVDSTNNRVGIGTTSPSATLDLVSSGTNSQSLLDANSAGGIRAKIATDAQDDAYMYLYDSSDALKVAFRTDSNPSYIVGGGNFGIGTSSPNADLHISAVLPDIRLEDSDDGSEARISYNTAGNNGLIISADEGNEVANSVMAFKVDATERMRIDSSGRVGIGTSSPLARFDVESGTGNAGFNYGTLSSPDRGNLWYDTDGTGWRFNIGKVQSGSFTSQITIQDNGNVGIGNSSPDTNLEISDTSGAVLRLSGHTGGVVNVTPYDIGSIEFKSDDTSSGGQRVVATVKTEADTSSTIPGGELVFETCGAGGSGSLAERMRIDSSGNLLVGTTSTNLTSGGYAFYTGSVDFQMIGHASGVTSGNYYIGFAYNGSTIGAIRQSGTTGISYSTFSDYRLKENVTGITDGIERVKQLNPSRFNFIADADTTVDGFLAHEAQTVVPEAVHGEKDAVDEDGNPDYQGIDQAKLVPLLTAALQEAIAKIEALEAQNADFETRLTALEAE